MKIKKLELILNSKNSIFLTKMKDMEEVCLKVRDKMRWIAPRV